MNTLKEILEFSFGDCFGRLDVTGWCKQINHREGAHVSHLDFVHTMSRKLASSSRPSGFRFAFLTQIFAIFGGGRGCNRWLQDNSSMANVTFAQRHAVHCHFGDTVEVDEGRHNDQNVKYLMRLSLKEISIKSPNSDMLWLSNDSPKDRICPGTNARESSEHRTSRRGCTRAPSAPASRAMRDWCRWTNPPCIRSESREWRPTVRRPWTLRHELAVAVVSRTCPRARWRSRRIPERWRPSSRWFSVDSDNRNRSKAKERKSPWWASQFRSSRV